MKSNKILISILTIFATLTLFISCGESDPYYMVNWEKTYGYATYTTTHGVTRFTKFYNENEADIPAEAIEAIQYSHPYSNKKNPKLRIIVDEFKHYGEGDDEDIGYVEIARSNYEQLDSRPIKISKFFAYVDGTNVYIISDLFSKGYRALESGERPKINNSNNQYYRITFYFSGGKNYNFEIVKENDSDW